MTQATDLKQVVEDWIPRIVAQLREQHPVFQKFDRTEQIREHTDATVW